MGSGSLTAALPLPISWGLGFLTLRELLPTLSAISFPSLRREGRRESFAEGLCVGQTLAARWHGVKGPLATASGLEWFSRHHL